MRIYEMRREREVERGRERERERERKQEKPEMYVTAVSLPTFTLL